MNDPNLLWWRVDRIGPIGLVDLQASGGLAVELQQVEFIFIDSRIEFSDGLIELVRIQSDLFRQFGDGIRLFRLLVGSIVYLSRHV